MGAAAVAGGNIRFAPLNSWPDNANLDKARRLLWPVKKKYGNKLSWADLILLAGQCRLRIHGTEDIWFRLLAGPDIWHPGKGHLLGCRKGVAGPRRALRQRDKPDSLENPLAAVQMGLIYVNPEGVQWHADPAKTALEVRETFARMAMNDEETAALTCRGPYRRQGSWQWRCGSLGPEPEGGELEDQGLGWLNPKKARGVG
jgi:catalase-peroxidase